MPGPLTDADLVDRFEGSSVDHDNKDYFRGLLERELRINRCESCGTWHHPHRSVCPACWSSDVVATAVTGRGVVHMVTFLHQGPPAPGVDYATPYPVATVELDEQQGLRFSSAIVGAPNDQIVIGAPVELAWIDRNGVPVPVFRLVTS